MSDLNLGSAAKICHQAIKAYQESIGDRSKLDWQFTSPVDRSRLIRAIAFRIDYPHLQSREIHQNWLRKKLDDGWTHGELDSDYKTHPLLVDYALLDNDTKTKHALFCAIVDTLVAHAV